MTAPTLPELAAAVAEALKLEHIGGYWNDPAPINEDFGDYDGMTLLEDGSNVFNIYWRARCTDWLLARGWSVYFEPSSLHMIESQLDVRERYEQLSCPAAEFPARAIFALTTLQQPS